MPRAARVEFPGAIYHVTARGNNQRRIYLDAIDCEEFLAGLATVVERRSWKCRAYCLMTNHVHLVIELTQPTLALGMAELIGHYARRFNRRHGRREHLFGSRYGAELIETERHSIASARYVVLNPVRAGICAHPDEWPWSSYRATAGLEPAPAFLSLDWSRLDFGDGPNGHHAYARFVAEGMTAGTMLLPV